MEGEMLKGHLDMIVLAALSAAGGLHTDPSRQSCADPAPRGLETIFRCHWRSAWRNPATGEPGMIPDYLERLARELSFDRSLARNVRQEVEDHLWEAVAADPTGNMLAA